MVYEYRCPNPHCGHKFDVVKPAADMEKEELCGKCNQVASRSFVPSRVYFSNTKVQEAEYNPGLGCIVNNKQHRQEICRQKGLEEIGNEKPDSLHKHFEKKREEKREKAWAEVDKGWVGVE